MKYAIKVPIPDDDWLYVTQGGTDGLEVILYDTLEEAQKIVKIMGGKGVVVEYKELIVRECIDWIDSNVGMIDEEARRDLLKHFGIQDENNH